MRLRIRPSLMAATAGLVIATTAAIGLAVGHLSGHIVEDLVDRRFRTIAEAAAADVAAQVKVATGVLHEQQTLAAEGLLPLDDATALGRRFAERLRQQPQLAWISYGDRNRDSFVGATRLGDGTILVNHSDGTVDGGRPHEAVALPDGAWRAIQSRRRKPYTNGLDS